MICKLSIMILTRENRLLQGYFGFRYVFFSNMQLNTLLCCDSDYATLLGGDSLSPCKSNAANVCAAACKNQLADGGLIQAFLEIGFELELLKFNKRTISPRDCPPLYYLKPYLSSSPTADCTSSRRVFASASLPP